MPPSPPPASAAAAPPAAAAAATATALAQQHQQQRQQQAGGRSLPLYSPADQEHLSPLVCLMRSQLELFSATPADVAERAAIGGISQQITPGRVGIRCVHCKGRGGTTTAHHVGGGVQQQQMLPSRQPQQQAKGSTSYPTSLRILHQAVRNWQRYHFGACPHIPQSAQDEFARLTTGRRCVSSKDSQAYWIQRGRDVGLVDVAAPRRVAAETKKATATTAPSSAATVPSASSESGLPEEEKGGGVYFEDEARLLGLEILVTPPEGSTKTSASRAGKGKRPGPSSSAKKARTKKKAKAETTREDANLTVTFPSASIHREMVEAAGPAMAPAPSAFGLQQQLLNVIAASASSQAQTQLAGTPSYVPFPAPSSQDSSFSPLDGNLTNITAFTPEEEQQELASLSLAEFAEVQSDVRGLSGLLSQTCSISAMNLHLAFVSLNQELSNLPTSETAAYYRAVELCPDQVSFDRKRIFLEHENGNARLAAETMAGYWTHRVQLFGPERAFLPMTISGAMKDEAMNMSNRRLWTMAPVTDTAGRTILYHTPGRRDFSQYSFEQEMQAMWYLFETVIENATSRKKGVVVLADLRNYTIHSYSLKIATVGFPLLSVLPTRVRAFHCCYPNPIVNTLLPLSKRFMERRLRLRLVVHEPSPITLLASLNRYCLPGDRVPTDLGVGGSVVINISSWMLNRMVLENSRQNQSAAPTTVLDPAAAAAAALLLSQQAVTSQQITPAAVQSPLLTQQLTAATATTSLEQPSTRASHEDLSQGLPMSSATGSAEAYRAPSSKKSRIMKRMESPKDPGANDADKFSHLNDRNLYEHIMKERRRTGVGRKADPRMDKAVLVCLDDPNLSRMDALCNAGFDFPGGHKQGARVKNPTDAEGVTFQQRRDQLNRRLRQAQGYVKAARNGSHKYELAVALDLGSNQELVVKSDAAESLILMASRDTPSPPQPEKSSK